MFSDARYFFREKIAEFEIWLLYNETVFLFKIRVQVQFSIMPKKDFRLTQVNFMLSIFINKN